MTKKSNLFYLAIFAAIAIISAIILHHAQSKTPPEPKNTIDTFVNRASYVSYNKLGQLNTSLTAAKAIHIKNEKTTYFSQPNMLTYTEDRVPWHIKANHAKSDDDMHQVFLSGHVIIHQLDQHNSPETTIKTTELTVFPQQSIAKSQAYAFIYREGSVMHGKGLFANLKTGKYELLSQSEGIYIPEQSAPKG